MRLSLSLALGQSGASVPVVTTNAQLVLNKAKKTGFTYFIRML